MNYRLCGLVTIVHIWNNHANVLSLPDTVERVDSLYLVSGTLIATTVFKYYELHYLLLRVDDIFAASSMKFRWLAQSIQLTTDTFMPREIENLSSWFGMIHGFLHFSHDPNDLGFFNCFNITFIILDHLILCSDFFEFTFTKEK